MAKRIKTTLVTLIVLVAIITLFVSVLSMFSFEAPDRESPDAPSYFDPTMGEGDPRLDLEMPDENASDAEKIEFVVELYNIACENYKQAEKAAFQVIYTTNMDIGGLFELPVPGNRYCLKDGDKRYYLDFAIPNGDDPSLGSLLNIFAAESSWYGEAQYTDSTMDYIVSRKIYSDCGGEGIGAGPEYLEDGTISADWGPAVEKQLPKTVYAAYQEGEFHHTDHNVSVDTIIPGSVTIEYNEEFGYYTCDFELDPDKVPQSLLDSLRNNSGQPTAHYTKLEQSMTIWDSGYFRTYHAYDNWETDGGGMSSLLDFATTYYFNTEEDADKFDINNYQYMAEMCHK